MSELMGIIKETQVRLFRELFLSPDFIPKVEAENKKHRDSREATIKAENPGTDRLSIMLSGIYQEIHQARLLNKIEVRVTNEILNILMTHLSEKSYAEATQKLKALTADEVFKDAK